MVLVSTTGLEVNDIHDPIGLLKQVQGTFKLLTLDEPIRTIVEFSHHDWDLVF